MSRAPAHSHVVTVRKRLREQTAAVHQSLHQLPGFVRLSEGRLTLSGYRGLLARLYGFHRPLERGLRGMAPDILDGFDLHSRERSSALKGDLLAVGMSRAEVDALPMCGRLPPIRSNADLLGRLYVVEGAGLGGRVLAAKLDRLLGPGNPEGRRFLAGRAAPDPLPWPVFCGWLETRGARADLGAIIESAEITFRTMAHWICEGETDV